MLTNERRCRAGGRRPARCRGPARRRRGSRRRRGGGGGVLDERAEPVGERLGCGVHDRHLRVERELRALDRLVVEEGDDRLAERHALDREQAVPAGVQLVDDDVGVLVEPPRLVVVEALDDLQVDRELLAGGDHVLGALAAAAGRGVERRPGARGRRAGAACTRPGRSRAGRPRRRAPSGSRRRSRRSGRRPARAQASSSGGLPRMSEPRKCITDCFRFARKSRNCRDFGTSVSPK